MQERWPYRPAHATRLALSVILLPSLLIVMLAACGGAQSVDLGGAWPDETGSYQRVVRNWSRGDKVVSDFDLVLEVHATFMSPELRTAYVKHLATRMSLPADDRAALLEEQRKRAAEFWEVELLVSTYVARENDLQKGERSIWRVVLADDQGNEVTPAEIKRDRRPLDVIRELFPTVPDFSQAYVVKFPRSIDVLRPDATELSLRVSGPRAALKLVWRAK